MFDIFMQVTYVSRHNNFPIDIFRMMILTYRLSHASVNFNNRGQFLSLNLNLNYLKKEPNTHYIPLS